jgi:hypothetical protein
LRNRDASEKDISDEERDKRENELFSGPVWSTFDKNKLGRHALKIALIKMRNRHIKQSIPKLISDIQLKLDICLAEIEKLGQPRTTNQAQFTIVNRIAASYSTSASGAIDGHYESLSDDEQFARRRVRENLEAFKTRMSVEGKQKHFNTNEDDAKLIASCSTAYDWAAKLLADPTYAWVRSAIQRYRGNEDPGEVNSIVKTQLWKQQVASWKSIASQALGDIERTVDEVNTSLFEKACADDKLRIKIQTWLHDDFQRAVQGARDELHRLVESERDGILFTLHPMNSSRKHEAQAARIRAILHESIVKNPEAALPQAGPIPLKTGTVPPNMIVDSLLKDNPELVAVLNTHDSLAAYYDVALYRFIDNFALQVVERHLLGPRGPLRLFTSEYVSERLYGEQNAAELYNLAGEDPDVAATRAKLEAERASLEASKNRVQAFKLL